MRTVTMLSACVLGITTAGVCGVILAALLIVARFMGVY